MVYVTLNNFTAVKLILVSRCAHTKNSNRQLKFSAQRELPRSSSTETNDRSCISAARSAECASISPAQSQETETLWRTNSGELCPFTLGCLILIKISGNVGVFSSGGQSLTCRFVRRDGAGPSAVDHDAELDGTRITGPQPVQQSGGKWTQKALN